MPARGPRQDDLFAPVAHTPGAEVAAAGQASRSSGQADAGGEGTPAQESVSIAWYAERQAELYRKGIESASAYWKARGVTWPNP